MIKVSNQTIFILNNDGSKTQFDPNELQTKIIQSCLSVGIRDSWLAEDITLAIEYALQSSSQDVPTYTEADINTIVIKVLEQSGYPEMANAFRKQNKDSNLKVNTDLSTIQPIIQKYLDLNGSNLEQCTRKVCDACNTLNISEVSPILILELGKYYKEKLYPIDNISVSQFNNHESEEIVLSANLRSQISSDNLWLFEQGIIEFYGISQFLPAVKIDLNLYLYLKALKLEFPITEMGVIPTFATLAQAINELMDLVFTSTQNISNMPIYLRIIDMHNFSSTCLGSQWPDCSPVCQDLVEHLQVQLQHKVYKVSFL